MKKTLLLFIFIIPLTVFSQSKKSIDGFLNIPFGSDSVTVKNAFLLRGAIKDNSHSDKNTFMFLGFDFSGRKVFGCIVKFIDNKAYEANLAFSDFDESDILNYFDSFSADIRAVYGKGEHTDNFGDSNNSMRIRRLRSSNAVCHTVWFAKNNNAIELEIKPIESTLDVILTYRDNTLGSINVAKKRSDL